MALSTGEIIDGKYRIIRELGSGAMGAVYEGENTLIKRRVAIKVLLPAVAEKRDVVQRFEREAQAAGRIGSDHIVEVLDLGTLPDGGAYMVMEFLEGETLTARIRSRGRLEPRQLVPIAQQLLTGLEAAHDARIIHRDLKPDNVFLVAEHAGQPDFIKILDFGISKFNPLNHEDGMSMTRTGTVMGTPFYMAPEQAKGARDIDARSDLYAVGVILYEAVTGQVPFHAGTFNELIFKIVLETPPPPESFVPDLDPAFARLIRRAMSRQPDARFQSAGEMRDALSIWLHTGRAGRDDDIEPPPSDLDWDDQARTMLADGDDRAGAGTMIMADDDTAAHGAGTVVIRGESATVAMDPDTMKTRVALDEETTTDTRIVDPPTAQRGGPPKPPQRAQPPAPPKRASTPPPPRRPPPAPSEPPTYALRRNHQPLAPGAPTPPAGHLAPQPQLPAPARVPAELAPTASSIPKQRSIVPVVLGVCALVGVACAGLALLVMPEQADATAAHGPTNRSGEEPSPDSAEIGEPVASETEGSEGGGDGGDGGDSDALAAGDGDVTTGDEPADPDGGDTTAVAALPPPAPAAAPKTTPKPSYQPPPPPPPSKPPPAPPATPGPGPKPSPAPGRPIQTEL